MKIGKIITINDISVEIILSSNDIKIGDLMISIKNGNQKMQIFICVAIVMVVMMRTMPAEMDSLWKLIIKACINCCVAIF